MNYAIKKLKYDLIISHSDIEKKLLNYTEYSEMDWYKKELEELKSQEAELIAAITELEKQV